MTTSRSGDANLANHDRHLPRVTIPALAWIVTATLAVVLAVVASNGLVLVAVLTAAGLVAVARYGRR